MQKYNILVKYSTFGALDILKFEAMKNKTLNLTLLAILQLFSCANTAELDSYSKADVPWKQDGASQTGSSRSSIWIEQVDPLYKPLSFEKLPSRADTIRVARGETVTVQLVCYASKVQGNLSAELLQFAPEGTEGIALEPRLYWVKEVMASERWEDWAGGKPSFCYPSSELMIPDPLMPLDKYSPSLDAGKKAALWVEFDIPRDFASGLYEGKVLIKGSETAEKTFLVQVYDAVLPERQNMALMQWINMDLSSMNGGEPTHMSQVYDWLENIIVPFVSRYGQNCFNSQYYSTSQTNPHLVRGSDGQWKMEADFSVLGSEIEMFARSCPDLRYVQGGNVVSSNAKRDEGILVIRGMELNEDGSPKIGDDGNFILTYVDQDGEYHPEAEAYFSMFYKALRDYLASNTLPDGRRYLDVYLQTLFDEPKDPQVPAYQYLASYVKKGAPDLMIMDPVETNLIDPELIDFPCPRIDKDFFKSGGEYGYAESQTPWMYCCNSPQGEGMNRLIRTPLIGTRLTHWLSYRYHTTGFLHWGLNYWCGAKGGDPWTDAYLPGDPAGDAWIIWPGPQEVYPSIRLCAMRDSLRDYDLLCLYAERYGSAAADALCRELVTDCWTFEKSVERFRDVRRTLLESL